LELQNPSQAATSNRMEVVWRLYGNFKAWRDLRSIHEGKEMNAMQFEVAKLEAMQRARLAIGSWQQAMNGVQNATNTNQAQLQNNGEGQFADSAGASNLPEGDIRQPTAKPPVY
jgi:hypothetical protein